MRTQPIQSDYMEEQVNINYKMRAILIDWLVEVHLKFRLKTETLYLCVTILDRFLAKEQVTRQKLQLVVGPVLRGSPEHCSQLTPLSLSVCLSVCLSISVPPFHQHQGCTSLLLAAKVEE